METSMIDDTCDFSSQNMLLSGSRMKWGMEKFRGTESVNFLGAYLNEPWQ